jgi:hypothetical protein
MKKKQNLKLDKALGLSFTRGRMYCTNCYCRDCGYLCDSCGRRPATDCGGRSLLIRPHKVNGVVFCDRRKEWLTQSSYRPNVAAIEYRRRQAKKSKKAVEMILGRKI